MNKEFSNLTRLDSYRYQIPKSFMDGMLVPGIVYTSEDMLQHIIKEQVIKQIANVACLPGIQKCSFAMPDVHWGYGFPIGGVAAMDIENGVISPGGVGFDINCGVRLLGTKLKYDEIKKYMPSLVDALYKGIPSGVGTSGKLRLNSKDMDRVLEQGSRWAVEKGYGRIEDLSSTEESGEMAGANAAYVSNRAKERGIPQLGTLGAGNHFIEIGMIDKIYDDGAATTMGLFEVGQLVLWIHSGSRGLGHQVANDYIKSMAKAMAKYGIQVPDRQLACAPLNSSEGKSYLSAMYCAANYAWANRQLMTHLAREAFHKAINLGESEIGLDLVYDIAHNIAKIEKHLVDGKQKQLCIHRKGATRAFPPEHVQIPAKYSGIGQPVLIPGDMGRYSYIMTGTQTAMEETFGSTCHGAGRVKSRMAAKKNISGKDFISGLERQGIIVRAGSYSSVAEEASAAYKNIDDVIQVAHLSGISKKVARTKPVGVIKG